MTTLQQNQPRSNDTPATSHLSAIRSEAQLTAHDMSVPALLDWLDVLTADAVDPDPDFPGEVSRYLAQERLAVVRAELERRERLARIDAAVPSPADRRHVVWTELAAELRQRAGLPTVFAELGYPLRPAGTNHRRGCHEYARPCPVCGGDDRLRVWDGPNGRAWCRRCGWSADVITVVQSFRQCSFREAVAWLAEFEGVLA